MLSKISNSEIRDGCTYISLPLDVVCCIIARRMGKEKRKVRQVWEREWDRDGNGDGEGHGLSQSVRLNYLIMSHYWALINPHPSLDVTARTRRRREAFIPVSCFLAPSFCPQLLLHFTFWFQTSHSIHQSFPAFIHLTCQYVILDLRRSACRKVKITNKISLIFQGVSSVQIKNWTASQNSTMSQKKLRIIIHRYQFELFSRNSSKTK